MTNSSWDFEAIVREVLRRLTAMNGAGGTGGLPTSVTAPGATAGLPSSVTAPGATAGLPSSVTAPGATAGLPSSVTCKKCGAHGRDGRGAAGNEGQPATITLDLTERLVTLSTLDGKLAGVGQVRVTARAVVTPAVRDALKERKIELVRS